MRQEKDQKSKFTEDDPFLSEEEELDIPNPFKKLAESFVGLEFPIQLLAICDLLFADEEEFRFEAQRFSKKYFTLYYDIDLATFNKWIMVFCPEIWDDNYKKKRKFSEMEAIIIFDRLGVYKTKGKVPRNHKELSDIVFEDSTWEKSKRYRELQFELSEKLNGIRLNVLPPKIVYEILSEELENYPENFEQRNEREHIKRFSLLEKTVRKYRVLSDWEIQVKLRALRIWFFSNDNDEINHDFQIEN